MTEPVSVSCAAGEGGWTCRVRVGEPSHATEHVVSVSAAELERFAPGAADPRRLVEASFAFLLERESKESILARFALSTIERYFPEYPAAIKSRRAT